MLSHKWWLGKVGYRLLLCLDAVTGKVPKGWQSPSEWMLVSLSVFHHLLVTLQ